MRRLPAFLLTACFALAGVSAASLGLGSGPALAQTLEVGGQARVAASDRGVNVRAQPEVRSGNVVATARDGDVVQVVESAPQGDFTWYRVESLPGAAPAFAGWIRGDLLTAAASADREPTERTLPEFLAQSANGSSQQEPAPTTPEPLPYAQRTDWSRDILRLYPAIEGCVRVNSAPPVTVLRAVLGSRGLTEVVMIDSAGRRWDCVISGAGGTPIRYDPLSGTMFMRDRLATEPFFVLEEERPRFDPACHSFEHVVDPTSGAHLGWLFYRTCP